MTRRSKHKPAARTTTTLLDELAASPTEPLPKEKRDYQLGLSTSGIESMRVSESPGTQAWEDVADLTNLLEMLVEMGLVTDAGGWIAEAAHEMALAVKRRNQGMALRLTRHGLTAVSNAFEGNEMAMKNLPARTMVRAVRETEVRVREIRCGKRRSHDVEVVAL